MIDKQLHLFMTLSWLEQLENFFPRIFFDFHLQLSGYYTKQSDDKAPVMLEAWVMWSTPLLPMLPGILWPGVLAPDRVLSMG